DFWGFPEHYYRVEYAAPGAPALADSVRKLLAAPGTPVQDIPDRGLDHGAYVPLVEMYPDADIPVLQMSLPTLDPRRLMETGRKLAPLRDEGVLIVGSGFFTHNLAALRQGGTPSWSAEFDDWGRAALDGGDIDTLLDFTRTAPAGTLAHPRTEHFAPLFVTLGAADATGDLATQRSVIDGFWMGLAKRSVQFG
ncbi:class III extradiol ring-cleavage dioxygenase, partial [Streptomyces albidoflavus]